MNRIGAQIGDLGEIQRIGTIVGGQRIQDCKREGFRKVLWKTWLGQVDSSGLSWGKRGSYRYMPCHTQGCRDKEVKAS